MLFNQWIIANVAFVVSIAVACTCFAAGEQPEKPGVTKANVNRIRKGMTESEVTTILGPKDISGLDAVIGTGAGGHTWGSWTGAAAEVTVSFTNGEVFDVRWRELEETPIQRISRYFHSPYQFQLRTVPEFVEDFRFRVLPSVAYNDLRSE
jgi:hypothetical protein